MAAPRSPGIRGAVAAHAKDLVRALAGSARAARGGRVRAARPGRRATPWRGVRSLGSGSAWWAVRLGAVPHGGRRARARPATGAHAGLATRFGDRGRPHRAAGGAVRLGRPRRRPGSVGDPGRPRRPGARVDGRRRSVCDGGDVAGDGPRRTRGAMNPGRAYPDQTLLIRLVREARPCWPYLLGLLTIGFLTTPLALLTPLPLKIAVDSGLGHRHLPGALRAVTHGAVPSPAAALTIAVVLLLATALLRQLLELADRVVRAHAIERLTLDLRARLFRHVQRLSLSYHDRHGTADSNYRIQKDVPDAQAIVVESLFPSITAALTLFGMLVVTARLDWQLALAALVISPVLFLTNRYYRRRFRVRWREAKNLESSGLAVVQEALAALRVVKAFGQEDWEQRRFVQRSGEGMWARIRLAAVEGRMGVQVGLLAAIGTAVVLFVGMRHVQTGVLTLGELLLIMGYI